MRLEEEPKEAFLYEPLTEKLKKEFQNIFRLEDPIKPPVIKIIFDKIIASIILTICLPIIIFLFLWNIIEGIFLPENRGPLFFYYYAVSTGKKFKKYKIRLIKEKFIDKELQKKGDWHAFSKEWTPESKTYLMRFHSFFVF